MLKYELLQTPQETKMLAIDLYEREDNESVDREAITKAIKMLYDENAEIKALRIYEPHIDSNACLDYEIIVESNGKNHYCYNLGCCFLDLNDLEKLYKQEGSEHESLKILRGDRYYTHPLYYKDYGRALREKVEQILKDKK